MRLPTIFTNGLVQLNVYFKIVNEIQGGVFSITGCSGIQLNMDYVNVLVSVSVSLSLSVCKCVCIVVCVCECVVIESERVKQTYCCTLIDILFIHNI